MHKHLKLWLYFWCNVIQHYVNHEHDVSSNRGYCILEIIIFYCGDMYFFYSIINMNQV